jgi:hypothetical protein
MKGIFGSIKCLFDCSTAIIGINKINVASDSTNKELLKVRKLSRDDASLESLLLLYVSAMPALLPLVADRLAERAHTSLFMPGTKSYYTCTSRARVLY